MISYLVFPHWIGEPHIVSATNEATGYAAERMWMGLPRRPARSTGDNASWNAVFNAGANSLIAIDTICSRCNVGHIHVQQHASDSWGAPSVNTEVSHVRETIAAAGITLSGCTLTRNAGTWTAHELKDLYLRFATGGTMHTIDDNLTTKLYTQGESIAAGSGDAQIVSPRKWQTLTQNNYQYLRVLVEAQQTVEDYYSLSLAVGLRTEFTGLTSLRPTTHVIGFDGITRGGLPFRTNVVGSRREWALSAYMMSVSKYDEVRTQILDAGQAPIVLIPDASNPYDWAFVYPELSVEWRAKTTTIRLLEVA